MRWFAFLMLSAIVFSGCSATQTAPAISPTAGAAGAASTAVVSQATPNSYPAPQDPYPAAAEAYPSDNLTQGPEFAFNEPITASDTEVTGTGGVGVPIRLIDITDGGTTLAETTVGSDGTFIFGVTGKLTSGNRLGLMLGNVQGTNLNANDYLSGPGYQDLPQIGIVFDMAVIE